MNGQGPGSGDGEQPRTLRWARIALVAGALLLAAAATLTVWDAATDDPPVPVITGRAG